MADIAQMPRREVAPKNWAIELMGGTTRQILRAKLHSADEGWIKFLHDDGKITMLTTRQILCVREVADA